MIEWCASLGLGHCPGSGRRRRAVVRRRQATTRANEIFLENFSIAGAFSFYSSVGKEKALEARAYISCGEEEILKPVTYEPKVVSIYFHSFPIRINEKALFVPPDSKIR
jgi:hypothetical protein